MRKFLKTKSLFDIIALSGFWLIFFSNLTWAAEVTETAVADAMGATTRSIEATTAPIPSITMSSSSSEVLEPVYAISNLEICPGQRANVTLPFPYGGRPHGIRDDEIRILTETTYTVLSDKSREIAFVGTLRPCVLVALRDESAGKAIVIHKHVDNSMADIVILIKSHIPHCNLSSLFGVLFTATPKNYNKDTFQGRTHKEELGHIREFLIKELSIKEPKKIKSKILTATLDENVYSLLGGYPFAESCVFVDSSLNITSTCFLHERLFFAKVKLPPQDKTHKEIVSFNVQVANNYLSVFNSIMNPTRTSLEYSILKQALALNKLQERIAVGLKTERKSYEDVHLVSLLFNDGTH